MTATRSERTSLCAARGGESSATFDFADAPLSDRAKREFLLLQSRDIDHMAGLTSAEKKLRLSRMSYRAYLKDVVKVDAPVLAFYQPRTHSDWGAGIDQ